MRYLKTKIALAQALKVQQTISFKGSSMKTKAPQSNMTSPTPNRTKTTSENRLTPESYRATKNIAKNFGKAICKFAASPLALLYLTSFVEREGVSITKFVAYVESIRHKIDGLQHFRAILLKGDKDTTEITSFKKIFTEISEVFIKYFSVNWIFHSKVSHKEAHLKFRFKVLRRIQAPELFTYLKSSSRGAKKI